MLRVSLLTLAAFLLVLPASAQDDDIIETVEIDTPPPPPIPPPAPVSRSIMSPGDYPDGVDVTSTPDFTGELTDQDPLHNGKPYDAFTFSAQEGYEVTVTMTTTDFDNYLIVRAPGGQEWENDDFNSTRVSRVVFNAPTSGDYEIWATSFSESGRGSYEIRVSIVRAEILSTVSGRLDYEDRQMVKGEYVDTVTVQGPRDGTFYIDLMPLGFTGYMRITSPSGAVHRSAYRYGERTIRMGPYDAERGDWTVDVTTNAPDEVGAYDVRVIALDEQ